MGAGRKHEVEAMPTFLVLVTAPVLLALLLPSLSFLVDRIDGWVFRLPDDPTRIEAEEDLPEKKGRKKSWETSSSDRIFSWNRGSEEDEELDEDSEDEEAAERDGPVTDSDSGGLDGLADELFGGD